MNKSFLSVATALSLIAPSVLLAAPGGKPRVETRVEISKEARERIEQRIEKLGLNKSVVEAIKGAKAEKAMELAVEVRERLGQRSDAIIESLAKLETNDAAIILDAVKMKENPTDTVAFLEKSEGNKSYALAILPALAETLSSTPNRFSSERIQALIRDTLNTTPTRNDRGGTEYVAANNFITVIRGMAKYSDKSPDAAFEASLMDLYRSEARKQGGTEAEIEARAQARKDQMKELLEKCNPGRG